ncbi:MAG: 2-amino-4-hydroxy-6-hydroxymethyldihydropteridine diphosphokinase [Cytophagaceae bacterium]
MPVASFRILTIHLPSGAIHRMNKAYILLGSNLGDRKKIMTEATEMLQEAGSIVLFSSIYKTAAWGKQDQPDFLNQVIVLETALTAEKLLTKLMETEMRLGRVRADKWAERTIDMDILYFNDEIIVTEHLKVPHPQIQFRRFTLVPLFEIAPDLRHPVLNISSATMLERCVDKLEVIKL